MDKNQNESVTMEELSAQAAVELPPRHLMATVSVLGLPLLGVSDVALNVDTTGPGWLVGSLGSV
jgi:hypothetical protein